MSDLFGIGSIFNAISNSISSGLNYTQQKKFNEQQQKNWETQFEYTKYINDLQMQREDNAIQRSVADYQAAGLNKLLAVGQPSQAGTLTSFQGNAGGKAPTLDEIKNPMETAMELMQAKANMNVSEAEARLKNEMANTEADKRGLYQSQQTLNEAMKAKTNEEKKLIAERIKAEVKENMNKDWNLYLSMRSGSKTTEGMGNASNPWAIGYRLALRAMYGENFDADGWLAKVLKENDAKPKGMTPEQQKEYNELVNDTLENKPYGSGRGHKYGY